jgi:hypothetical protein
MELLGQLSKSSLYIDNFQSIEYFLPAILSVSYIISFPLFHLQDLQTESKASQNSSAFLCYVLQPDLTVDKFYARNTVICVLLARPNAWPKVISSSLLIW